MKRFLLLILFLSMLIPALSYAGLEVYYREVSATAVNTVVTVSLVSSGNKASTVTISNDGTKSVYINTNGSVATTANQKLLAGEAMVYKTGSGYTITTMGIICAGGDTSTVRVFAFPTQ